MCQLVWVARAHPGIPIAMPESHIILQYSMSDISGLTHFLVCFFPTGFKLNDCHQNIYLNNYTFLRIYMLIFMRNINIYMSNYAKKASFMRESSRMMTAALILHSDVHILATFTLIYSSKIP